MGLFLGVGLRLCLAVALCAIGLATPAVADDTPTAPSALRVGPPTTAAPPPARAAPVARSYPRTFDTYDGLIDYARDVAETQDRLNGRLAELIAREEMTRALVDSFDPPVRKGLLQSRSDVVEYESLKTLRAELVRDSETRRRLLALGAVAARPSSWQLPLVGEDTQDFGPTPYWFEPALTYQDVYYAHFHAGTDIAAPLGAAIVAPAWGLVTFAGTMGDGAEVVVLAHDDGLVSLYAHLDDGPTAVPVKAGDAVQAGDWIGNVGLTGMTTGAHLHWSVWHHGVPIDPLSMIRSQ